MRLSDLNKKSDILKSDLKKIENIKIKTGQMIKNKIALENELENVGRQIAPLKAILRRKTKQSED